MLFLSVATTERKVFFCLTNFGAQAAGRGRTGLAAAFPDHQPGRQQLSGRAPAGTRKLCQQHLDQFVRYVFDGLADAGKAWPEHRCRCTVVKTDDRDVAADSHAAVFDRPRRTDGHGVAHAHHSGRRVGRSHKFFGQRVT